LRTYWLILPNSLNRVLPSIFIVYLRNSLVLVGTVQNSEFFFPVQFESRVPNYRLNSVFSSVLILIKNLRGGLTSSCLSVLEKPRVFDGRVFHSFVTHTCLISCDFTHCSTTLIFKISFSFSFDPSTFSILLILIQRTITFSL